MFCSHPNTRNYSLQLILVFVFVFVFEEREKAQAWERAEEEGETQAGFTPSAEPNAGVDLMTVRS